MKVLTLGGPQSMVTVNRAGFFRILLDGRKPEARAVKTRIVTEVMPSLQEHGCYPPPQAMTVSGRAIVAPDPEPLAVFSGFDARLAALESGMDRILRAVAPIPEIQLDGKATLVGVQQIAVVLSEVHASTVKHNGQRVNPTAADFRVAIRVVLDEYRSRCPACKRVVILDEAGNSLPNLCEWDHMFDRTDGGLRKGWPVCRNCNRELGPPNGNKIRRAKMAFFERYLADLDIVLEELAEEEKRGAARKRCERNKAGLLFEDEP